MTAAALPSPVPAVTPLPDTLSSWEVRLAPETAVGRVSLDAAHWLGCHWFDWITDDHARRKDYALGAPRLDHHGHLVFTVRCLTSMIAQRLQDSARPNTPLRVGSAHYRVASPPRLLEVVDLDAVRATAPQKVWRLRTLTPMTFTNGNRSSGWPQARTIVRSLLARYPDTAHVVDDASKALADVYIRDGDGHTETLRLRRVTNCFSGWIDLAADDQDARRRLAAPLAYAAFSGLGASTAWGFGTVEVIPKP